MSVVVRTVLAPLGLAAATGCMFNHSVARSENIDLAATTRHELAYILAIVVAVIGITITWFLQSRANSVRVVELSSMIHQEVLRLKKLSCMKLRSPNDDSRIVHLRIDVRDNVAFVYFVTVGECFGQEPPRWFEVEPNGRIFICSEDAAWCAGPLVPRLEELRDALHNYSRYQVIEEERVRLARESFRPS